MIGFTSLPPHKLQGSRSDIWTPDQLTSWLVSSLVPWINKRSGLVLLQSTTVSSAVASVDFTAGITSEFPAYLFVVADWNSDTDNVTMYMRVSEDSGTTWEDDASDYRHSRFASADGGAVSAGGSAADTEIELGASLGNSTGESMSSIGVLTNPSGSTYKKIFQLVAYNNTSGEILAEVSAAQYDGSTNAINGLQFLQSSGNIDGGTFSLYGIRA